MDKNVRVGIVDYGVGNVFSVEHAFSKIGYDSVISHEWEKLEACSHLILPGVGAFDAAYRELDSSGMVPFLEKQIFENEVPILGICVGMQLMLESSTENGQHDGLGWIKGTVDYIDVSDSYKVPHVGWNDAKFLTNDLFEKIDQPGYFYFDHSYYCNVLEDVITSKVEYGMELTSSFRKKNIFGVQFHPEKSQFNGLMILKNFIKNA